jgi:hypothetical protein
MSKLIVMTVRDRLIISSTGWMMKKKERVEFMGEDGQGAK